MTWVRAAPCRSRLIRAGFHSNLGSRGGAPDEGRQEYREGRPAVEAPIASSWVSFRMKAGRRRRPRCRALDEVDRVIHVRQAQGLHDGAPASRARSLLDGGAVTSTAGAPGKGRRAARAERRSSRTSRRPRVVTRAVRAPCLQQGIGHNSWHESSRQRERACDYGRPESVSTHA
jgi:hypothetical protein